MFYLFLLLIKISSEEGCATKKYYFLKTLNCTHYKTEWGKYHSPKIFRWDIHSNCLSQWDLSCESQKSPLKVHHPVTHM